MKLGVLAARAPSGLATRLAWITGLRLALLLALFGATTVFYLRDSLFRYQESQRVIFWTFGLGFSLAAAYAALLRRGKNLEQLALGQILLDQVTWSAFVYVSGGPTSGATSFYALSALVGSVLIGQRGALTAAAMGLSAYTLLCVAFVLRWIKPPADQAAASYVVEPKELAYPFLLNSLGIIVVALLAGYLAERLRATGGRLELAEERAVAAERLATLGRVAAGLAHEIRNPLGSIRGSIEMLRESPALGAEDRELCDIVQRESKRLETLVSDMMELAKPRKPAPEPVSIVHLAKEVVALSAHSERSGSGDVKVEYAGPEEGAIALCDGGQMRQVLWNLVRNAVQVSEAGSVVRVKVSQAKRDIVLGVQDQGPGIPDEQKKKLFDAFYTTRTQGAGLGLAVVKRIVDDHAYVGVRMDIESPIRGSKRGAEFRVRLKEATS